MINFFRKIRQNLLSEGNLKRYLIYALGEIALVMIGILLALQVNNWNEQQKTKALEQQLLYDLLREFQSNQKLLAKKEKNIESAILSNKTYIDKLLSGTQSYSDMARYESEVQIAVGTSDPTFGAINSLIASGDIKWIRNSDLKYLLTSWQDYMADFNENEKIHMNEFFEYADYMRAHLPWKNVLDENDVKSMYYDISSQKIESMYLDMGGDIQYRNYIILNRALMEKSVLPELSYVKDACARIIQLIEGELKENE